MVKWKQYLWELQLMKEKGKNIHLEFFFSIKFSTV